MMNEDLDILRVVRPPADGPDRALVERERNALMAIIESSAEQSDTDRRRRRCRVAWMVPATVAVVSLTAAAGWAALRSEPARDTSGSMCVAEDVDAGFANDGTDPVEACRRLWEAGSMVSGVTEAPPLVACVSATGGVVVIEGADAQACERAEMASWTGGDDFSAVGDAVTAVRIGFHDRADATGNLCASEADWREHLGAAFAERDLGEWTFDVNQVEPGRHCYDLGEIDPGERRIELIGVPGEESIGCDPRTGC